MATSEQEIGTFDRKPWAYACPWRKSSGLSGWDRFVARGNRIVATARVDVHDVALERSLPVRIGYVFQNLGRYLGSMTLEVPRRVFTSRWIATAGYGPPLQGVSSLVKALTRRTRIRLCRSSEAEVERPKGERKCWDVMVVIHGIGWREIQVVNYSYSPEKSEVVSAPCNKIDVTRTSE